MLEIDTNILVRYLVADDQAQFKRVAQTLKTERVRLSPSVLLEAEWVLRSVYRIPTAQIVGALRAFIGLPSVHVENREAALNALAWTAAGMEFADALHLAGAADVEGFLSFDRDLAKQARKLGAPAVREP